MEFSITHPATAVPKLLSIFDAAKVLGVTPEFCRKLARRGSLKVVTIGRRVLVPVAEVERIASEGAR